MASSYLNIVTFLLTTILYYFILKPSLPYSLFSNKQEYEGYLTNNYIYLAVYFVLVMVIQFLANASIITSTCGGSVSENMGYAGLFTFIPWSLIFGVLIVILTLYPGFKSAFADVIGYYYVSSSANKLLTDLLINQDVQSKLESDATITQDKKNAMQSAADTILKICGNASILINQIVPSNFDEYWNTLKPLMKSQYQTDGPESSGMKSKLFDLVVSRDNVGEAMWLVYTGILLTSIVQLKITTKGCASSAATMSQNYQKFVSNEKQSQTKQQQATSTIYTITS
jgi:hypothetical protein